MALSLKAVNGFNVFALQRADTLRVSTRGYEISEDLQLFPGNVQVVSKAKEISIIQQQEQKKIIEEFHILWTLLSKPVAVILQVS